MSTVATALQNIELIDLKIKENKRLAMIAGDKFKKETKETDLRKCEEWNTFQTVINNLVDDIEKIEKNLEEAE